MTPHWFLRTHAPRPHRAPDWSRPSTPPQHPVGANTLRGSVRDNDLGRVLMVVPTYNEVDNLRWIVGRLLWAAPGVDVLVVDDNSPDGTGAVAEELARQSSRVSVLHRSRKDGLGAAYLHGFAVALERGYGVIGEMDADGSHQPEQLPRLLAALADADLVIGSRWVTGGSVVNWPWRRKALSVAGNLYARTALGIPVRDITAGYRVFRRAALEVVDLGSVESTGYCFQVDLTWRTAQAGMRIIELPIQFVERVRGESKMNRAVAAEAIRRITGWGVAERRRQARVLLTAVSQPWWQASRSGHKTPSAGR